MRRLLPLAALLVALTACRKAKNSPFTGVELGSLDGSKTVALASCPTAKCLTVVVAPWCGYCRRGTPMIKELRTYLKEKNVDTRIVVGMDDETSVRDYAKEFGGDALLDSGGKLQPAGVPHFFISDGSGAVLKAVAGLPPDPTDLVRWILE